MEVLIYSFNFEEMEIDMLGSILEIKYMDLVSITLLIATAMKDHGMKDVSKVLECILSQMVIQDVASGTPAPWRLRYLH